MTTLFSSLRTQLKRIPRWLIYVVVFVFLASALASGWDKVKDYSWQFKPGYAVLALGVFVLYVLTVATLTTWVVRRMKITLPYRTGITMFLQATMTRYIPGGVWPFASVAARGAELKLPASMLVTALILKEMFVAWASAFAALPVIFIRFHDSPLHLDILAAIGLVASLVFAPLILRLAIKRLVQWRKLSADLAIAQLTSYGGFFLTLLAYLAAQVLYLVASLLFLMAVTDFTSTELIFGALAMNGAWLFGLLVLFAPQGIGAREAAMVYLLLPFVDAPVAIALSLGFRLMTTLADLVVFIPLLLGISRRKAVNIDSESFE